MQKCQALFLDLTLFCSLLFRSNYNLREFLPNVGAGLIENGMAAFIGVGRMTFAYPDFARDAAAGKTDKSKVCLACGMCSMIMRNGSTPGCVVRDAKVYLPLFKQFVHDRNIIV